MKTVLQVDSIEGFRGLLRRVKAGQFHLLYQGAFATYVSSVMGHYPWVSQLMGDRDKFLQLILCI